MILPVDDEIDALLRQGAEWNAQGRGDEAMSCYVRALQCRPNHPETLFRVGEILLRARDFSRAEGLLSFAAQQRPTHAPSWLAWGDALRGLKRFDEALACFRHGESLDSANREAKIRVGAALGETGHPEEGLERLNALLGEDPEWSEIHLPLAAAHGKARRLTLAQAHLRAFRLLSAWSGPDFWEDEEDSDLYFFHREEALEADRERRQVPVTVFLKETRLCYYDGEPHPDDPPTVIGVPLARLSETLAESPLRFPRRVIWRGLDRAQLVRGLTAAARIEAAAALQERRAQALAPACYGAVPRFVPGEPLRVMGFTSRHTTVMQYASRSLLQAFARLGCQTLLTREENEREQWAMHHHMARYAAFAPHVMVSINHARHAWLPRETFHVTWWQDEMDELTSGAAIPWRERDLVYSLDPGLDRWLIQSGAPRVERQGFCIDAGVFHPPVPGTERRRKVVFVGVTHAHMVENPAEEVVRRRLLARLEAGEAVDWAVFHALERETGVPARRIHWDLIPVREAAVHWLCQCADLIDVEIYGRGWEEDPVVRPFFKGPLPHGAAVADLYRHSRFALVPHPYDLQSQRLAEAAACGCIPVVFDCRSLAAPPHWEDHCLWFRTREELRRVLQAGEVPAADPVGVAAGRTYDVFARRILAEIHQRLGWTEAIQ
ncbi:MAG: hypothetical protein HQL51_12510 [Magnetococcales bacterium]|nr:hypothetical protein [Magnetococcales bacterium]